MLLSPIIKELIEKRIGKEIRYPADCVQLSYEIEKHTTHRISANTLKRLLGFIGEVQTPRLYTLDAIAKYIHFNNWNDLSESLNQPNNTTLLEITEQNNDDNRKSVEKCLFRVVNSLNSRFQIGEILEISFYKPDEE